MQRRFGALYEEARKARGARAICADDVELGHGEQAIEGGVSAATRATLRLGIVHC